MAKNPEQSPFPPSEIIADARLLWEEKQTSKNTDDPFVYATDRFIQISSDRLKLKIREMDSSYRGFLPEKPFEGSQYKQFKAECDEVVFLCAAQELYKAITSSDENTPAEFYMSNILSRLNFVFSATHVDEFKNETDDGEAEIIPEDARIRIQNLMKSDPSMVSCFQFGISLPVRLRQFINVHHLGINSMGMGHSYWKQFAPVFLSGREAVENSEFIELPEVAEFAPQKLLQAGEAERLPADGGKLTIEEMMESGLFEDAEIERMQAIRKKRLGPTEDDIESMGLDVELLKRLRDRIGQ